MSLRRQRLSKRPHKGARNRCLRRFELFVGSCRSESGAFVRAASSSTCWSSARTASGARSNNSATWSMKCSPRSASSSLVRTVAGASRPNALGRVARYELVIGSQRSGTRVGRSKFVRREENSPGWVTALVVSARGETDALVLAVPSAFPLGRVARYELFIGSQRSGTRVGSPKFVRSEEDSPGWVTALVVLARGETDELVLAEPSAFLACDVHPAPARARKQASTFDQLVSLEQCGGVGECARDVTGARGAT